jgi:hypothetical protein
LDPILAKHNFDFWYCRVAGKEVLPNLVSVKDSLSDINNKDNFTTLDSFRLLNPVSGGAIGFRVEKNLKQYSPLEWFYQKQFKGEPEALTIDGFNAVRSGNTVYIGFGNAAGTVQYTNILVISLAQPASAEMENIFNQIIDGLQFVKNVKDVGLCYAGPTAQNQLCSKNSDCATGQTCNVEQSKFRRDMIRVIDASVMTRGINTAKAAVNSYPIIAKDSFIPGISSSRWPSWSSFMNQLGIVTVVDPINEYTACAEGADSATCWSVKSKKYQCGAASSVYHYRTVESGKDYQLGIPLEQDAGQQGLWQGDWVSVVKPKLDNNFCVGQPLVAAAVCGDGAIGEGEKCDPPGAKVSGTSLSCSKYNSYVGTCSATCEVDQIQCANLCGDGIIQPAVEDCDDGAKYNGTYNHCGLNCKNTNTLGSCGNGVVETKNEVCDIGTINGRVFIDTQVLTTLQDSAHVGIRCLQSGNSKEIQYNTQTKVLSEGLPPMNNGQKTNIYDKFLHKQLIDNCASSAKIGSCSDHNAISCFNDSNCPDKSKCITPVIGTKYSKDQVNSCNWNCKALGSYCGDGVVNAADGEQCDGDTYGNQCTYVCKECKWASLAANSTPEKIVPACTPNTGSVAAAMKGCGDGTLDSSSGEECDLGLECAAGKDPTTSSCKVGGQNNIKCVPGYGQNNSCQYCTASCKKGYVSGGFCGDGVIGGSEECDGESFGAVCNTDKYDYHNFKCLPNCTVDKKAGQCFSCTENTTKFSTGFPSVAPVGSVIPGITVVDSMLGWLPGYTGARIAFVRNGKDDFALSPNKGENYFFSVISPVPAPSKTFQLALDANKACLKPNGSYKIELFGSHKTESFSAIDANVSSMGGAFDYAKTVQEYIDLESFATPKSFNITPSGKPGDYRIVLKADIVSDVSVKITKANKSISDVNTLKINEQAIMLEGVCKNYAPPLIARSTIYDERKRIAGCVDSEPFVETDYAAQFNGNIIPGTKRYITLIRRPNEKIYDSVYEYRVRGLIGGGDVEVYKYQSDGTWKLVFEASLLQISQRGQYDAAKAKFWDVLTIKGEGTVQEGSSSDYQVNLSPTLEKKQVGFSQ